MFVLDTNILSAIMGARPVPEVARWIARQRDEDLFTTSVCQAEIAAGIAIMPQGQRREALTASAQAMFIADFRGRVLPFDTKRLNPTRKSSPRGGAPDTRPRRST